MTKATTNSPNAFRDSNGHTWVCRVTFGVLEKAREVTGYDGLDNPTDVPENTRDWVVILYATLEGQIEKAGLTPEQFAERLDGETLNSGIHAWLEGLMAFTRPLNSMRATLIKGTILASKELMSRGTEVMDEAVGRAFGDSPELPVESTPAP